MIFVHLENMYTVREYVNTLIQTVMTAGVTNDSFEKHGGFPCSKPE